MKRRAFTLIELLCVVVILAAFSVLSSQLFISCLRTNTDVQRTQAALFNFDGAVTLLRRDMWGSKSVQLLAPDIVWIGQPDGTSVTWCADDPNFLVRAMTDGPSQPTRRFPNTIAKLEFRTDWQGLLLRVTPQLQGVPVQEFRFVSALNSQRRSQ